MHDGFVKEPATATRKDFDLKKLTPDEVDRIKLTAGVRIHRNTKAKLAVYAENEDVQQCFNGNFCAALKNKLDKNRFL